MHPPPNNPHTAAPTATTRVATILMLCPLLAVSDSVINALGLGIVAIVVTLVASIPLSVVFQGFNEYGRLTIAVAVIGTVVTCAMLVINAYFHELYLALGAYLPLLIASGLLLTRYDVADSTHRASKSSLIFAGLRTGLTFALILLVLGATRELIGRGSLLFGASAIPVTGADNLSRSFFHPDYGFVLAILPPGAFIAMGILFAVRNAVRQNQKKRANSANPHDAG